MEEYDYKGYVIEYTDDGYYKVDFGDSTYEFTSYDEAADWLDSYIDSLTPELKTYHIFYIPYGADQGYDEFVKAYSKSEAKAKLRRMYPDIERILNADEVDV